MVELSVPPFLDPTKYRYGGMTDLVDVMERKIEDDGIKGTSS